MAENENRKKSKSTHNRLAREKSPYLLQHATNPVDWYPWSDEAFEKARDEDKPVFLSIGYSTCHWCHVMEHESFEDPKVAELMNNAFVSIKVDREERPDIDSVYMSVCQLMAGSGGWPLTIIMTPDKKPFYAATYIPKDSRFGHVGLLEMIPRIKEIWERRKPEILKSADEIIEALTQSSKNASGGELGEPILRVAFEQFRQIYDSRFGGFGRAPKFPTPHNLLFLLRYWLRSGESPALQMVEHTLEAMRRGGIYDHIGFGFHRYSTDTQWLVPHFEKMLYDQALIAIAYIETYQATGKEEYRETACEIFSYVLGDMADPGGAFYSAEDADSEGEEGKYYLWSEEELRGLLSHADANLIMEAYSVSRDGNYDEMPGGRRTGLNILHLTRALPQFATQSNMQESDLRSRMEAIRQRLFLERQKRVRPYKDDKILTDWNGLMIAALALGAQAFDKPGYAQKAGRAADFIMGRMRNKDGRLLHRYRDGEAAIPGSTDDYAFLIWGLLNLYEATFDVHYLHDAIELNSILIEQFWNEDSGAFHLTSSDAKDLPFRPMEIHDGAVPSGNSVAAMNLLRLARITCKTNFEMKADKIINAFSSQVRRVPQAFTMLLSAYDFALGPSFEVVIAGTQESGDTRKILEALRQNYLPNKVVIFKPIGQEFPDIARIASFVKDNLPLDGKATAYVCRNHACELPVTDSSDMLRLLNSSPRH